MITNCIVHSFPNVFFQSITRDPNNRIVSSPEQFLFYRYIALHGLPVPTECHTNNSVAKHYGVHYITAFKEQLQGIQNK